MNKLRFCLALVGLLALSGQAAAVINTIDAVPAATLLVPYFEVDSENPSGINTLFSINNASATAVLVHVTVWSDWSVPVLDFDVYLTGFDVQTISLRDILVNGNLPVTASAGQDTVGDTISPQGPISQDIDFASCDDTFPYVNPAISASFRAHLIAILQGNPSPSTGLCYGVEFDDGILRGYVTADTVNACNLFFPSDGAFYDVFLTDQNVIWGDYFYVNPGENFAQGDNLAHIEACVPPGSGDGYGNPPLQSIECPFVPGDHTFYGRYNAATAIDQREPLATTWVARYLNGAGFTGGTDYAVWREGNAAAVGISCALAGPPSWFPLDATQIVVFDEQENPVTQNECPSGDPTCEQEILIPVETQRVDVATGLLAPFDFGFTYLNLQHSKLIAAYGDQFAQSWVTTIMDAEGRFSVGFAGVQLDNANTPNTVILPVP